MNPATTKFRRILRNATLGLGLAAVVGAVSAAPALADDYRHHDRHDARDYAWQRHARWERDHGQRYAYAAPSYSYRYAPPAPAYVAPPSFNLVFPIR